MAPAVRSPAQDDGVWTNVYSPSTVRRPPRASRAHAPTTAGSARGRPVRTMITTSSPDSVNGMSSIRCASLPSASRLFHKTEPIGSHFRELFSSVGSAGPGMVVLMLRRIVTPVRGASRHHSLMTRSAHSTSSTKIFGLPHFAPQLVKSASVTPRAREQAPQENTGMCLTTIFSIISLSGGQPMGLTASTVVLRIR